MTTKVRYPCGCTYDVGITFLRPNSWDGGKQAEAYPEVHTKKLCMEHYNFVALLTITELDRDVKRTKDIILSRKGDLTENR